MAVKKKTTEEDLNLETTQDTSNVFDTIEETVVPVKKEEAKAGAPIGNSNNASSIPPKSRSDAGSTPTGVQGSGDQKERGQNQDSGDNIDTVKVFEGEKNE